MGLTFSFSGLERSSEIEAEFCIDPNYRRRDFDLVHTVRFLTIVQKYHGFHGIPNLDLYIDLARSRVGLGSHFFGPLPMGNPSWVCGVVTCPWVLGG
jgi:hypothetical protein